MPDYHRYSHEAMTTIFDVLIVHEDEAYARGAAQAAFNEILRLEGMLNRHNPGTDIGMINRLTPGQWLRVNLEGMNCLELSARAYVLTGGAFDPCFRSTQGGTQASAMEALLLSRPEDDSSDEPAEYLVGIDPAANAFTSAELDLGAIGKGYALDCAMEILRDYSITNVLLNSGTSTVLAAGPGPHGQGWTVGVSGDFREDTGIATVNLLDCALSGSGTAVKGDHIKNPATGQPAAALAAWARTTTAAWSDAISTALMIMDDEPARAMLTSAEANEAGLHGAIVIYPAANPLIIGPWPNE